MSPDIPAKREEMKPEGFSPLWADEDNFVRAINEEASLVFDHLDPNLKPEVHVLGVSEDHSTVVVHPGDEPFTSQIFADVKRRYCHYLAQYKARHLNVVGTGIPSERYVELMALQAAIADSVRETAGKLGLISFPSLPIQVGQYLVSVLLNVQAVPYNSHYSLQGTGFVRIESLLEATRREFLGACEDALRRPEPGHKNRAIERDPREVIRAAGRAMVDGYMFGQGEKDRSLRFFHAFDQLSALPYELRNAKGSILCASEGHPNVEKCLAFREPVTIRQVRAVRKLLEISTERYSLLMDENGKVYGIGKRKSDYNIIRQDLFEVRFVNHHTWELVHAGKKRTDYNVLMRVEYGMPQLHKPRIDSAKLASDLRRVFPNIQKSSLVRLRKLAESATTKLQHGTILIISSKAASEAQRLKSEGRPVEPTPLSGELLERASAIDGAILLDQDGICHAIGVILDGQASIKGTSARGARYNSAVRYLDQHPHGTYAIVVSQDGTADLLPNHS